jgi:class 3 adenylate cyclase
VPDPEDLRLNANHAKDLKKATVVYADLDGSTTMVDKQDWRFSAEVYKSYLRCASDIIRSEGGAITAYDGDRVMAIFTGNSKNTSAVRCAMKINYAALKIIQPALEKQYDGVGFTLKHVVGIDTSQLRAARIGVRGDNDLVWIGRAVNYAAKLASLTGKATWITKSVYDGMRDEVKTAPDGKPMWTLHTWTAMNDPGLFVRLLLAHILRRELQVRIRRPGASRPNNVPIYDYSGLRIDGAGTD